MKVESRKLTPAKRRSGVNAYRLSGKQLSISRLRRQLNTQRMSSKVCLENNKVLAVELENARMEVTDLTTSNLNLQKELLECQALNYRYEHMLKGDMQYNAIENRMKLLYSNYFFDILNSVKTSLNSVLDDKLKEISEDIEVLVQEEKTINENIFSSAPGRYTGNTSSNARPSPYSFNDDSNVGLPTESQPPEVRDSNKPERQALRSVENTIRDDAEVTKANLQNQVEGTDRKRKPKARNQSRRMSNLLLDLPVSLADDVTKTFKMDGAGAINEQERSHLENVSQHESSQSTLVADVSELSLTDRLNKTEKNDGSRNDETEQDAELEIPKTSSKDLNETPQNKIRKQRLVKKRALTRSHERRRRRQKLAERKENAPSINASDTEVKRRSIKSEPISSEDSRGHEKALTDPRKDSVQLITRSDTVDLSSNTSTLPYESETDENARSKRTTSESDVSRSRRLRRQAEICYKEPSIKTKIRRA